MMNIFGKLFGGKKEDGGPEKPDMSAMMRDPRMLALIEELQSKLSPEDQRELFRRVLSRNPQKVQEFLASKVPDWQEMLKRHGLM